MFRLPLVRCKYKHCSDVQSFSFLVFQSGQLRASWLNFLFQRMFMLSCCYRRDAGFVEATLPFRILTYYTSQFLFRSLRGFTFLLKMMKMYFLTPGIHSMALMACTARHDDEVLQHVACLWPSEFSIFNDIYQYSWCSEYRE